MTDVYPQKSLIGKWKKNKFSKRGEANQVEAAVFHWKPLVAKDRHFLYKNALQRIECGLHISISKLIGLNINSFGG